VAELERRHLGKVQQPGGCDPAVAGDNLVVLVNQDLFVNRHSLENGSDLLDLFTRVGSSIARVRLQLRHGAIGDDQ